jgi:CheY-like chemotaxis protein
MGAQRILVVDDEPSIAETVGWVLRDEGYAVAVARNGREALARVREQPPDLVITDLMMPIMDGWALCRALQEDPATSSIPVVITTALPHLIERGGAAFSAYLPKPFDLEALSEIVARVLTAADEAKGSTASA